MQEVPPFLWSDAGTFDSPKQYTVPGAGEVQPYTATATYTNASGQAILPALRIKSAEGALLSLTFPVGSTIAAGASSEVTFVPPFGSAQGTSTPTTPATDFGPSSLYFPLIGFGGVASRFVSTGVTWVYDAAVSSGGYVTRTAPANGDEFVVLAAFHPANAIFGFGFTFAVGADYGKIDISIASIGYQLASRGSGVLTGKIQDIFHSGGGSDLAGYGPDPVFKLLTTQDCYNAGAIAEQNFGGTITFIPGGAEGAILTNLNVSSDPYTGTSISDGGPGWYALRFKVNGRNVASAGFRMRVISLQVIRDPDGSGF